MAKFPSEPFVKESVRKYLEDQKYPAIIKEFMIEGGKIDFVAYRWRDEGYGIQYFVVECKDSNDLEVRRFIDIIQKQVSRYQDRFPDVYLAIPKPAALGIEKQFYATLCKFHRVGLLIVNEGGKIEERTDPERPAPNEVQERMGRVDSLSAAILGFLDVFESEPKRGPSPT